jgi:hypothetical protein
VVILFSIPVLLYIFGPLLHSCDPMLLLCNNEPVLHNKYLIIIIIIQVACLLDKTRKTDRHAQDHTVFSAHGGVLRTPKNGLITCICTEFGRNRSSGLGALTCRWIGTAILRRRFVFEMGLKTELAYLSTCLPVTFSTLHRIGTQGILLRLICTSGELLSEYFHKSRNKLFAVLLS